MTNDVDRQYLDTLRRLLRDGSYREGRNGGTYSLFGHQMRFDLRDGFPLLTTKRVHFKSIVVELLWFLRGDTNTRYLREHGVTIWDEWADANGNLGPVYGAQWRSWITVRRDMGFGAIDQIANVIASLKADPYSRRHIVTAWNPAEIDDMALPPCHCLFQFYVTDGRISCQLYQRSADWFLGVPFNIASYALLTHLIAREVGLEVGEFVHTFGDFHLYASHVNQAQEQLSRAPHLLPTIGIAELPLHLLEPHHIGIIDYNPHSLIKAEVSK